MKLTSSTVKRGNSYKTEYRIDSVYIDTYTLVSSLITELNEYVELFPAELRSAVVIDMEDDSHYATFSVAGPASKEDTDKAIAKDKKVKADWLARAIKERSQLDSKIAQISKEIK